MAGFLAAAFAGDLRAQSSASAAPAQLEMRADATSASSDAAHLGLGLNFRAGPYARTGLALAVGAARPDGSDSWIGSQRAEATVRFLLDPYGEQPRALYAGGGVVVRRDGDSNPDARLLLLVGFEGRTDGQLVPAIEVAVGGGTRLGVVLRRTRRGSAR